jgi:uncharacterized phage-associated protein
MLYTASQIADYFLGQINVENGDSITPLKLQKLVYYAQAWHYTLFDKPLFEEKIEAWTHGPVVVSLWEKFNSISRNQAIDLKNFVLEIPNFSKETKTLLEEINQIYGEHSGSYLEQLTHSEEPWKIARGNLPECATSNEEITLVSMKSYYQSING